ncbi:endonuclease [Oxalobacteraceae bacterium]|nr:endonuclease [Oxalobacteraceae bacterium]
MPEGPTILLLSEAAAGFAGKTIAKASGSSKDVDLAALPGQKLLALRTWGKHLLLQLPTLTLRVHLLLFGSCRINQRKNARPSLSLRFDDGGELNFYACSVKQLGADLDQQYDWRSDILSEQWDEKLARKRLRALPDALACDALLDQDIFSGVGNVIKNEVLFRIRVHPAALVGALPAAKQRELVAQARRYATEFLEWKRADVLKKHLQVHKRSSCPRCHLPVQQAVLGKTKRRAFFCEVCQRKYAE